METIGYRYIRMYVFSCIHVIIHTYIHILEFVCQIKTSVLHDYKSVLVVMIRMLPIETL